MRQDLTEIILVVDRSGSMQSCAGDAQGGINSFIKEQKEAEGDANFTLVQFDTEYEFVHKGTPIQDVPDYQLNPRGMTALLDAVGRAIVETGERLSKMDEAERPGNVICVIVTDGHENSSREYTADQIKKMIDEQRETYSWIFNFLGADETAFQQAASLGISKQFAASYDSSKSGGTHRKMSEKVATMRCCASRGASSAQLSESMSFTEDDREEIG